MEDGRWKMEVGSWKMEVGSLDRSAWLDLVRFRSPQVAQGKIGKKENLTFFLEYGKI